MITPSTLTLIDAARFLGIGRTKMRELLADPDAGVPRLKIGDRILIPTNLLADWVDRRAAQDTPAPVGLAR